MDVLILHYHLEPGGVTRIIESQIRGIQQNDTNFPVKVLCGMSSSLPEIKNVEIVQDQRLNYKTNPTSGKNANAELIELVTFIRSFLSPETVIHAHNPNLGKNPLVTAALFTLAINGTRIINHYHDFADDRPVNRQVLESELPLYSPENVDRILYPDFPNYSYIVLNSCDYNRLSEKGISPARIHLMQNPVADAGMVSNQKSVLKTKICRQLGLRSSALLCTYPVRPIQRKNIGEFILMAVLFADVADFVLTLTPLNPVELPAYNRWKTFCSGKIPNIYFEAAEKVDFSELIAASNFCITTSVREGFGMVYLEPWLSETPVIGRNLPCVTGDLNTQGILFPKLYDKFIVPDNHKFADFKDLDAGSQEQIIVEAFQKSDFRNTLINLNLFLHSWLDPISDQVIKKNKEIVQQKFSLKEYGKQILRIYSEISQ